MSLTDIISKNEKIAEILEDEMSQLPKEIVNELVMQYNEINSKLEEVADEYGDEPEDGSQDTIDEDVW